MAKTKVKCAEATKMQPTEIIRVLRRIKGPKVTLRQALTVLVAFDMIEKLDAKGEAGKRVAAELRDALPSSNRIIDALSKRLEQINERSFTM